MKLTIIKNLSFIISIVLFSCQKERDKENPLMSIENISLQASKLEICGVIEQDVFKVTGGDSISFIGIFSDNTALSQYKIDIHNNFNCHGHSIGVNSGVTIPSVNATTSDWYNLTSTDISGTNITKTINLKIPHNVTAGNYHFSIQLFDEAGNENATQKNFSFKVFNREDLLSPLLKLNFPGTSDFNAKRGDKLKFEGTVTDNYSLYKGGNGLIFLSYTNLSTGSIVATDTYRYFSSDEDVTAKFELSYTVSNTMPAGVYKFTIIAYDGVRNVSNVVDYLVKLQ